MNISRRKVSGVARDRREKSIIGDCAFKPLANRTHFKAIWFSSTSLSETLKPVWLKCFALRCEVWTKHKRLADLAIRALTRNAALTVEVGRDGVPCQEAVDRNLIDDVEQQEGQTGEAEGLQQTPCVAWRRRKGRKRRRAVSSTLTFRIGTSWKKKTPNSLLVIS